MIYKNKYINFYNNFEKKELYTIKFLRFLLKKKLFFAFFCHIK